MIYVEKRAQLDLDYSRNLTKLVNAVRPALKEEVGKARCYFGHTFFYLKIKIEINKIIVISFIFFINFEILFRCEFRLYE